VKKQPVLHTLTGPRIGQAISLMEGETRLGRHGDSGLQLLDPAVSRSHCVIHHRDEAVEVEDLTSRHGTFVNGLPVTRRVLADGDLLVVGSSTFLLRLGTPEPEPTLLAADLDPAGGEETALELSARSVLLLQPEQVRRALDPRDRLAGALAALLAVATAVGACRRARPLAETLLDQLVAILPAERAALFLRVRDGTVTAVATRGPAPPALGRSLTRKVLEEGVAVLCGDVAADPGWGQAESVAGSGARSLLVVPLLADEEPLGLLYLDNSSDNGGRSAVFNRDHLELATAVAGIGALALANALLVEDLVAENRRLQQASLGHGLVGESPALARVVELLERAAPSDSTVLLCGESGTGKELAARALHLTSRRAERPFVAINCAAISEALLESELFGHEKGAFTGAITQKPGKLEVAHGGTVFLDEVGELPLAQQAKLLRALETKSFERVGGTRPVRVDLRLVAATHRDLERAVREGAFREDLFYRLNVIRITLPPLRERRQDIPLLALHFAHQTAAKVGRRVVGLAPAARRALLAHDWPGNVRELANAIERAVVLGEGDLVRAHDLPEGLLEGSLPAGPAEDDDGGAAPYHQALNREKRRILSGALAASDGNVTHAAAALGLHPNHLHRLIKSLGLRGE
jgi:Nif-specific regulatory protein